MKQKTFASALSMRRIQHKVHVASCSMANFPAKFHIVRSYFETTSTQLEIFYFTLLGLTNITYIFLKSCHNIRSFGTI